MGYDQKLCDYLVKRFNLKGKLLDVGCGDDKHCYGFARFGLKAYGIDKIPTQEWIPWVWHPFTGSRKECDLEKDPIPFPDNTFDVVFCKS
ncbi:hypothetical protein LCGC14_2959430, partial [marine sediment metagenome]